MEVVTPLEEVLGGEPSSVTFQPLEGSRAAAVVGERVVVVALGEGAREEWAATHTVRGQVQRPPRLTPVRLSTCPAAQLPSGQCPPDTCA